MPTTLVHISSCRHLCQSEVLQFFVSRVQLTTDVLATVCQRHFCGRPAAHERVQDDVSRLATCKHTRFYELWGEHGKVRPRIGF